MRTGIEFSLRKTIRHFRTGAWRRQCDDGDGSAGHVARSQVATTALRRTADGFCVSTAETNLFIDIERIRSSHVLEMAFEACEPEESVPLVGLRANHLQEWLAFASQPTNTAEMTLISLLYVILVR